MKKIFLLLVLSICQALIFADEGSNATKDLADLLDDYFRTLSQESALDFTIILSSNAYYEDGGLKEADALAFASQADDDTLLENFNLSTLTKQEIKSLKRDAKKEGVLLSLYQDVQVDNVRNDDTFNTEQASEITAAAANVVLHPDGFVRGLEEEIRDAMDLTENEASIQVLEYFEEGSIKRNTTTTVYSNKVNVLNSNKMTPRMVQTSEELLRKAYKVDMEDRAPFISQLFHKEYPRYEWKVSVNSTEPLNKKSVSITLATGHDKYDIVGILKKKVA